MSLPSPCALAAARLAQQARDRLDQLARCWAGRHRFRRPRPCWRPWRADLRGGRPDRVVFSGDATTLGFEAEFARAAALLGVTGPDPLPGLAVPGNHDYYTRAAAAAGLFERYFAPWQAGERIGRGRLPVRPAQRPGLADRRQLRDRQPLGLGRRRGSSAPAQLRRLEPLLEASAPGRASW